MRNIFYAVGLFLYVSTSPVLQAQKRCGEHVATEKFLQENPQHRAFFDQEEASRMNVAGSLQKTTGTVYVIPVVFHVLHTGGPENISDAQIHDAVRILNEDFRKLNADNANVVAAFQGVSADAEIEFRLAQKDPNGNCTSGIDRIFSTLTNNADDNAKLNTWPRNKYLNIWVVNNINIGGSVAGYAYKPAAAAFMPQQDGIMILHDYTGSIGTATGIEPHSLSHEVGHWINLSHTWGNSNDPGLASNCSIDDGITDTPNTIGWTSCNLAGATCGSVLDNVQNFMEYSFCSNMFTQGQADVMRTALNSVIAQRNQLTTASNLAATGTDGNDNLCEARILNNAKTACLGQDFTFYDASYHGPTSWSWNMTNANPSSSNVQNPVVEFLSEGYVDVDLTVSNTSGTKTVTENQFLRVLPNTGASIPVSEGFENGPYPNNFWDEDNLDDDAFAWQETTAAAYSGATCMKMNNFGNTPGKIDELISPLYDFSNLDQVTIDFAVAYAQVSTSTLDFLKIYVSGDCGQTWSVKFARSGSSMASVPLQTAAFTPTAGTSEWRTFTFSFSNSNLLTHKALLKFSVESDGGNNLYIDNINITGTYNTTPVLFAPNDNSLISSVDTVIDWKAVGNVDQYEYQVDTTPNFNSAWLIQGAHNYIDYNHTNADTKLDLTGLSNGQTYYWRVRTTTAGVSGAWSNTWSFKIDQSIKVQELTAVFTNLELFPNPVSDITNLRFTLENSGVYAIEVFDVQGRKVDQILPVSRLTKGVYTIEYQHANLPSGMYYIRYGNTQNFVVQKMAVLANQ